MYQSIVEALLDHASKNPQKLAICFKKDKLTYQDLAKRIRKCAVFMRDEYRLGRGDIVMVSAVSKPEFVITYFAVQYLGLTVIPVDKAASRDTIIRLYEMTKPALYVTNNINIVSELKGIVTINDLNREASAYTVNNTESSDDYVCPPLDSIAEIIFTTGTTGEPKGAMHSYRSILAGTINTKNGVDRRAEDVELLPLPLNHSFGLRVLRTILYIGGTVILQNGFLFSREMTDNMEEYGCTGLSIVPASMEKLYRNLGLKFQEVFRNFRYIEISAGSLGVGMKQRMLNILPNVTIYNVWGSSETGGVIFLNVSEDSYHLDSLGKVSSGVEIGFVDDKGNRVEAKSPDTAGRMIMRGEMQMIGYYNMPEITEQTIVNGYLYTADLAYCTSDGFIYMMGRADDIMNVGGEKVSPIEIENIASLYDGIRECACISGEDKEGELGQIPVLYIVPDEVEFSEDKLREYLSERIEQYKIPREYIIINEIPRNAMKKIDRRRLREMYVDRRTESGDNPVISAIYGRRSIRNYKNKPIPKEILEKIVECGKQAPNGHNLQAWHFSVVTNPDRILEIKETTERVAARKKVYFYGFNNPNTIILVSNDTRDPYGIQDCSCAAENIMLAAYSYGIGSVWINALMKICDEPEIRALIGSLGVPDGYNVWAMILLGYPANRPSPLAKRDGVINWVE